MQWANDVLFIFLCISSIRWPTSFGSHLAYIHPFGGISLPENINWCQTNLTQFVDAEHTDISVSADGDFGEMKKTETPSKSRRIGRYAPRSAYSIHPRWMDLRHHHVGLHTSSRLATVGFFDFCRRILHYFLNVSAHFYSSVRASPKTYHRVSSFCSSPHLSRQQTASFPHCLVRTMFFFSRGRYVAGRSLWGSWIKSANLVGVTAMDGCVWDRIIGRLLDDSLTRQMKWRGGTQLPPPAFLQNQHQT